MKILLFITALAALVRAETLPVVAIMELTGNGVDTTDTRSLTNRLRAELYETGKYAIVEHGEMEAILRKQGFQQAGCTSVSCAVEAGRLLNTQFVIVGNIDRAGRVYSTYLRMVNVADSEIVNYAKNDCTDCSIEDVMLRHIRKVARIIAGIETESKDAIVTKQIESTSLVYKDYKGGEAGTIVIEALPTTEISLDGKLYGKGSMTIDSITVGHHELVAEKVGNRKLVRKIEVANNETERIDFTDWFHFCIEQGLEITVPSMRAYILDEQTEWFAPSLSLAFSWRDKNNSIQFGVSGAIVEYDNYFTKEINGKDVRFAEQRFAASCKFGYYRSLWSIKDRFKGELGLQTGLIVVNYGMHRIGMEDEDNGEAGLYFGGPGFNILAGYKFIFLKMSYLGWFGAGFSDDEGSLRKSFSFKNLLGVSLLFRM